MKNLGGMIFINLGGEEKNRLRSTMDDDWFSALTVLASERDILENFSASTIIDSFALCSPKLQNILGVHAGHSDSA